MEAWHEPVDVRETVQELISESVITALTKLSAAVDAVKAGNDMLLLPSDLDGAYHGLLKAVRSGEVPEQCINDSVLKILKTTLSLPPVRSHASSSQRGQASA